MWRNASTQYGSYKYINFVEDVKSSNIIFLKRALSKFMYDF